MGPDLWELFEYGKEDDEIAAIIRLGHHSVVPHDVRVVADFGQIITVRLKRSNLPHVSGAPEVASMIAGDTYLGPDIEEEGESVSGLSSNVVLAEDERRPKDEAATGRGVVVGIVDWGFDFAHPDFRHPDGSTRILALWDQRGGKRPDSPTPYGYGIVYNRDSINKALKEEKPSIALKYDHTEADTGVGCHGTHVASIAAGSGGPIPPVYATQQSRDSGPARVNGLYRPAGVAPEANLVFVHSAPWDEEESGRLGDSVTLLEAIDFILKIAGNLPCVINLSMGRHCDQHDGSTLVEQGLDAIARAAPGRAICMSAGNYFDKLIHAFGQLRPTQERTFVWQINEGAKPTDYNELQVWYSRQDRFEVMMRSPDGSMVARAKLGERAKLMVDNKEIGNIYHRGQEPNSLDNPVHIYLYKDAQPGAWEVTLRGDDVIDGRFHAWIEREVSCPKCQSHFRAEDADPKSTTGTICNGRRTIAVGAYDNHDPELRVAHFSSVGPTRDGRLKPDLCAPGVSVLAARSSPREMLKEMPLLARMSGTSMAAPHAAGLIALMFQVAPRKLRIEETHNLLLENTQRVSVPEEIPDRIGIGYLDISRAVEAARQVDRAGATFNQTIVQTSTHRTPAINGKETETGEQESDAGEHEKETVDAKARMLTESMGRLINDLILLRLATPPTVVKIEQAAQTPVAPALLEDAVHNETAAVESMAEALLPMGQGCSSVVVDCLSLSDSTKHKIIPKGSPEGDFNDRTEGDPAINFALQLIDYDINAYLPIKIRHAEALGIIRDFVVNRVIQTKEEIAVTITGSASRTGGKDYNDLLSCKRAICAAENLTQSLDALRVPLQRVKINPSGAGFTQAQCKGSECELGEWRSVLVQVHAPNNPPIPINPVDSGWDKYTIRCCSYHSQTLTEYGADSLGNLLKKQLPGLPSFAEKHLTKWIQKGMEKLWKLLVKILPPGAGIAINDLVAMLAFFPAEVVRETGMFEIREREKKNPRQILLTYSGFGLRIIIPPGPSDAFFDTIFEQVEKFRQLPENVKKAIKSVIKPLLSMISPVASDTPGPLARFDLLHPRSLWVFKGAGLMGKDITASGRVFVAFDSPQWNIPDSRQRPCINKCYDTSCENSVIEVVVGNDTGREIFTLTRGNLEECRSCLCDTTQTGVEKGSAREYELINGRESLLPLADSIVTENANARETPSIMHELFTRTGMNEALTVPWNGRVVSAAEMFDAFAFPVLGALHDQLEQYFDLVASPNSQLERFVHPGDFIVRRGEGEFGHVALVAGTKSFRHDELSLVGLLPERDVEGKFIQVVEGGARPHSRADVFARRITDLKNVLPNNQLILRVKTPLSLETGPTQSESASVNGATVFSSDEEHPILARGASGITVRNVQGTLNRYSLAEITAGRLALDASPLEEDGQFGPLTERAVRDFQMRQFAADPSQWDGIVGLRTWAKLDAFNSSGSNDGPAIIPPAPVITLPSIPPIATDGSALRRSAGALIAAYVPSDTGDGRFDEIAQDYGGIGTTCGFLCHWLLWRLGCTNRDIVNRNAPNGYTYRIGQNIRRIWNGGRLPFVRVLSTGRVTAGERPEKGDIVYIATPGGASTSEHVFVFLEEFQRDGLTFWRSADAGQRNAENQQCARYIERELIVQGQDALLRRSNQSTRTVYGWLSLANLTFETPPMMLPESESMTEVVERFW